MNLCQTSMDMDSGISVHFLAEFTCILLFYLFKMAFVICIVSNNVIVHYDIFWYDRLGQDYIPGYNIGSLITYHRCTAVNFSCLFCISRIEMDDDQLGKERALYLKSEVKLKFQEEVCRCKRIFGLCLNLFANL